MAENIIASIIQTIFVGVGKEIAIIFIYVILILALILVLLFIFSGINIIAEIRKNRKKGLILLALFIISIIFAFNKQYIPIILLSIYFFISLIINIIKKIIGLFRKI